MSAPDLQQALAQLQAQAGGPGGPPAVAPASLQASIQAELNARLAAAQAQFEADVQAAISETSEIQNSDVVTLRLSIGEEALFRRAGDGTVEELVSFLVEHGWLLVGVPTRPGGS